ncbi:lysozyme inhibitor LprI family protein [Citrobacter sedlakii]|uniref:Lysozyme inhibitor LprI family protein n=1 Tax=Citrobacter sedlakii TaxID=67826 RepID=A0ABS0ZVN1_9ENTR|nr:lysozyme inhibitor LprI family protein [Citrobacter sedlakii]MBJ8382809.1 lysozyme inhibitor LprI family protein [Citrobacter sedlakii]
MKRIVIAGATLLLCANALANECANATTQADMNACAITQYQTADKKLNDAYQHALKRAAPAQQALLKKAQTAWIAVRDADCALISSGTEGGSAQVMIANQCLADKTTEREAFLASLLQCEEGDMSCPLPPAG